MAKPFCLSLRVYASRRLLLKRDSQLIILRLQVVHLFQFVSESAIFHLLSVLFTTSAIHLNIHLSNFFREARHHLIVFLALLLQAVIRPVHIADFIGQLCDSIFHIAQLVPQVPIVALNMPQPLHLNLHIVKLASSAVIVVFRSICLQKLLPEHLDLLFGSVRTIHLHLRSIFCPSLVPLRHINHLLVVGPLLSCLELEATSLLLEVALDAIALLS